MEKIELTVMNRGDAQNFIPSAPTTFISIYTPGDMPAGFPHHPNICGVLKIAFSDINADEHPRLISMLFNADQAKAIKDFVQASYDRGIRHFMVHCDGGISRSAGVASALDIVFNNAQLPRKEYISRNTLVERRILEAFKGPLIQHD
jgi:predicted protein tyrosine phosphatase